MVFEQFVKQIKDHHLLNIGDRVVVAVSGGADSVALLFLLLEVSSRYRLGLSIAHLNHSLRGAESEADEVFVRKLGEELGLPVFVERLQTGGVTSAEIPNLEEWARFRRYDFLSRLSISLRAQKVALGHNQNDQAETVLLRLLRGSGTLGLSGIPVVRESLFIRPLLSISRTEIRDYLVAHELQWQQDSSNNDLRFLRNRVRSKLLPYIEADYCSGIVKLLARTAANLRTDAEALEFGVAVLLPSLAVLSEKRIAMDVPRLLSCPVGMQRHLLRHSMARVSPCHATPSSREIDRIQELLCPLRGGRSLKWNGILVTRDYDSLIIESVCCTDEVQDDYDLPLQIPGFVKIHQIKSEFEAFIETSGNDTGWRNNWEFWLSQEELLSGLKVRNWRPGDAYNPAGSSGPRKLKELFARKRISRRLRRTWPVVTLNSKIIFMKDFPLSADMVRRIRTPSLVKVLVKERTLS